MKAIVPAIAARATTAETALFLPAAPVEEPLEAVVAAAAAFTFLAFPVACVPDATLPDAADPVAGLVAPLEAAEVVPEAEL
jgi:hypothetical protein